MAQAILRLIDGDQQLTFESEQVDLKEFGVRIREGSTSARVIPWHRIRDILFQEEDDEELTIDEAKLLG